MYCINIAIAVCACMHAYVCVCVCVCVCVWGGGGGVHVCAHSVICLLIQAEHKTTFACLETTKILTYPTFVKEHIIFLDFFPCSVPPMQIYRDCPTAGRIDFGLTSVISFLHSALSCLQLLQATKKYFHTHTYTHAHVRTCTHACMCMHKHTHSHIQNTHTNTNNRMYYVCGFCEQCPYMVCVHV